MFEPFTSPESHAVSLDRNLATLSEFTETLEYSKFSNRFCDFFDVHPDDLLVEFSRHVIRGIANNPRRTMPSRWQRSDSAIEWVYYITMVGRKIIRSSVVDIPSSDILIDDYYPGSEQSFYGAELCELLESLPQKSLLLDCISASKISWCDAASLTPKLFRMYSEIKPLERRYGIRLSQVFWLLIVDGLIGLRWRKNAKNLVILTGNSECFPILRARVAGIKVGIIQHGVHARSGGMSFSAADEYFAIAGAAHVEEQEKCGAAFGNTTHVGSLRLHNWHQRNIGSPTSQMEPTILWVSNLEFDQDAHDRGWDNFYPMFAELDAISLMASISQLQEIPIYYYPRDAKETKYIRSLFPEENFVFLNREETDVYQAIHQANLIMSTGSTCCMEALQDGKKILYVNISGNSLLVRASSNYGLEVAPRSAEELIKHIYEALNDTSQPSSMLLPDATNAITEEIAAGVTRLIARQSGLH